MLAKERVKGMNRKFIVYFVSLAAFLGPFTQTIYVPIIPEVTNYFQTSHFMVNLTISIFTVFLALMQVVYGPLTDAQGRRNVILFGIFLYVLASLGCYFAPTIHTLLFFRALQGIGIAAGSVVAVTVIGDLYEGTSRGKAMGTFQMMVTLGPVLGPVIGGFLGGRFDFHSVFLALVFAGLLVFACNFLFLKETKPGAGEETRFNANAYLAIFKNRVGSSIILLGFIQYYAFYNFLVFLPEILSERYGLSAEQKGMVFLPMSLFIVLGSFLGGKIQARYEGRKVVVYTSYLDVLAILLFMVVFPVSLPLLIAAIILFGLFLGLSLPVQTTLLTQAFPNHRATAVGAYNFFRYMGMASGPIAGSMLLHLGGYYTIYGFLDLAFLGCAFILTKQLHRRGKEAEAC
ncbi:MFS transporter [Bacillaceae bacterium]